MAGYGLCTGFKAQYQWRTGSSTETVALSPNRVTFTLVPNEAKTLKWDGVYVMGVDQYTISKYGDSGEFLHTLKLGDNVEIIGSTKHTFKCRALNA